MYIAPVYTVHSVRARHVFRLSIAFAIQFNLAQRINYVNKPPEKERTLTQTNRARNLQLRVKMLTRRKNAIIIFLVTRHKYHLVAGKKRRQNRQTNAKFKCICRILLIYVGREARDTGPYCWMHYDKLAWSSLMRHVIKGLKATSKSSPTTRIGTCSFFKWVELHLKFARNLWQVHAHSRADDGKIDRDRKFEKRMEHIQWEICQVRPIGSQSNSKKLKRFRHLCNFQKCIPTLGPHYSHIFEYLRQMSSFLRIRTFHVELKPTVGWVLARRSNRGNPKSTKPYCWACL